MGWNLGETDYITINHGMIHAFVERVTVKRHIFIFHMKKHVTNDSKVLIDIFSQEI